MNFLGVLVTVGVIIACVVVRNVATRIMQRRVRLHRVASDEVDARVLAMAFEQFGSQLASTWRARMTRRSLLLYGLGVMVASTMRFGLVPAIGILAIPTFGAILVFRYRHHQLQKRIETDLITWIEQISYRMRAGVTLSNAVMSSVEHAPVSLRPSLQALVQKVGYGAPLHDAFSEWAASVHSSYGNTFATAMKIALQTGGEVSDACLRLAESLRQRQRLQDEVYALTSQMRSSAYILIALPAVFGLGSSMFDSSARKFLFHSGGGVVVLFTGIVLEVFGALWMRKIARVVI